MASSARAALIDVQDEGESRSMWHFLQQAFGLHDVGLIENRATRQPQNPMPKVSFSWLNCNLWTNYSILRYLCACLFSEVQLNEISGSAAISACGQKGGQWEISLALLRDMLQAAVPCHDFAWACRVWTAWVRSGFLCCDHWSEGHPDRPVWNAAITACETSSQWILALALLKDMHLGGYRCGNRIPMTLFGVKEWMNTCSQHLMISTSLLSNLSAQLSASWGA